MLAALLRGALKAGGQGRLFHGGISPEPPSLRDLVSQIPCFASQRPAGAGWAQSCRLVEFDVRGFAVRPGEVEGLACAGVEAFDVAVGPGGGEGGERLDRTVGR